MIHCELCGEIWTRAEYDDSVSKSVMFDDLVTDAIDEGFCPACGNTECVKEG